MEQIAPKLTEIPTPADTSSSPLTSGLGVSRDDIMSVYTNPNVNFTFEEGEEFEGEPLIIGTSPDGDTLVGLFGPPDNLTKTVIRNTLPSGDEDGINQNLLYLKTLILLSIPGWDGGEDWFVDNLMAATETGKDQEITTVYDDILLTLDYREIGKEPRIALTIERDK